MRVHLPAEPAGSVSPARRARQTVCLRLTGSSEPEFKTEEPCLYSFCVPRTSVFCDPRSVFSESCLNNDLMFIFTSTDFFF